MLRHSYNSTARIYGIRSLLRQSASVLQNLETESSSYYCSFPDMQHARPRDRAVLLILPASSISPPQTFPCLQSQDANIRLPLSGMTTTIRHIHRNRRIFLLPRSATSSGTVLSMAETSTKALSFMLPPAARTSEFPAAVSNLTAPRLKRSCFHQAQQIYSTFSSPLMRAAFLYPKALRSHLHSVSCSCCLHEYVHLIAVSVLMVSM